MNVHVFKTSKGEKKFTDKIFLNSKMIAAFKSGIILSYTGLGKHGDV